MEPINIWAIGLAVGAVLAVIARFLPREKLVKAGTPMAIAAAVALDMFLMKWLPRKMAEKVEEGLVCSVIFTIRELLRIFEEKLVENNKRRKK